MKKIFPFLVVLILFNAVDSHAQEPTQMEQVIENHDELMDKMPNTVKLINSLQTVAQNAEDKAKYELAIEELRTANRAMQDWMAGFGKRFDMDEMMNGKKLSEEKQIWLDEEEKKVTKLRNQIDGSIKKAKILLNRE